MITLRNELTTTITNVLTTLGIQITQPIHLEQPAIRTFGDYTTNVALQCAKANGRNPRELAQQIVSELAKLNSNYIEKTEIAGPGFINITLKTEYLFSHFNPNWTNQPTGTKAVIEYMQPNTNKPLHVGHLRNAVLGKALINLKKTSGWDVVAATVNNDRGLHITKSMWAYLMFGTKETLPSQSWKAQIDDWMADSTQWNVPTDMEDVKLHKGDFFVGHWYVEADKYVEDTEIGKIWTEMLTAWEDASDEYHNAIRSLWKQMNAWFYEGAASTYQELDVTFDTDAIAYESDLYQAGKTIILDGVAKGLFQKLEDGAIQVDLSSYNLPNKILLRRDGTGIYMTFDIELTRLRTSKGVDKLVWVVGNDQQLYFQQLFAVCEMLGFTAIKNCQHFAYGMVKLPEGKMSSRKGTVVYADDVLELAIQRAEQIVTEVGVAKDKSPEEQKAIARTVGIGAVKYAILAYDPLSELTFDIEKSVSFEGNCGPFIQYAHARSRSILRKASESTEVKVTVQTDAERALIHLIAEFDDVLERASELSAPHLLCSYLFELASCFNSFYATSPVIGSPVRIELTRQFSQALSFGLSVLGIEAPESM